MTVLTLRKSKKTPNPSIHVTGENKDKVLKNLRRCPACERIFFAGTNCRCGAAIDEAATKC